MAAAAQAVLDRLENARQGWWICSSVCSLLMMGIVSFITLGLFILADVIFQLPQYGLAVLLVVWFFVSAGLLIHALYRILREPRTTEGAARRVELSYPEVGSHLINLIQLTRANPGVADAFRDAAIEQAAARIEDVPFHAAASRHTRWSRWRCGLQTPRDLAEILLASALLMIAAMLMSSVIPTWRSSATRLLAPWRYVPQTGAVRIVEVTPGNGDVLAGQRLLINARIDDPQQQRPEAVLYTREQDQQAESSRRMIANDNHDAFSITVPAIAKPFQYRLQIGDSQSQVYHIRTHEIPAIRSVEVSYQFPDYLGLPPKTLRQNHADLDAPQYSIAKVTFTSSAALSRGYVQLPSRQIIGRRGDDPNSIVVTIPMTEQTTFTAHLFDEFGHSEPEPRINHLRVSEDVPPTVQIAKPLQSSTLAPGNELSVVVRAEDDYGLSSVRLEMKPAGNSTKSDSTDEPIVPLHAWEGVSGSTTTLKHNLKIDPGRTKAGESVLIRAVAVDRRSHSIAGAEFFPQESASPWVRVTVISREQQVSDTLNRLESVTERLVEILKDQIRARVAVAELASQEQLSEAMELAKEVTQRQILVQTGTSKLVVEMADPQAADETDLRPALNRLARGPMLRSVERAEAILHVKQANVLPERAVLLLETQDEIIRGLRRILERTAEIAMPLETRGAKMAAELVTNLQELLPGSEDGDQRRTKAPLTDTENETPIVGLPVELDAIVGELRDGEKAFFDELEKLSGSVRENGNDQLGGPTPEQSQRAIEQMASRQAELRGRAEAVDLQLQLLNYQPADLRRMIDMMKLIESELASGRYQSALRRRDFVLEGLDGIKTYLDGEFEVRRDRSSNLPDEIQRELLGSMLEASPVGWEDLNRKYFERLSGQDRPGTQTHDAPQASDEK